MQIHLIRGMYRFITVGLLLAACNRDTGSFYLDSTSRVPTATERPLVMVTPTISKYTPIPPVPSPLIYTPVQVTPSPSASPLPFITAPVNRPPSSEITAQVSGLNGFPENINPITGLVMDNPAILNRRPVMVKVSNYPRSGRPHAGLSFADMVFEYYIGEYANRFLAVYYGNNAPKIGPIRSGRLVDPQLVNMYGGVLVYGSADPKVDTVILNELGDHAISYNQSPCPPICGKDTHSVAGVFVDSGELTRYIEGKGIDDTRPDLEGMLFDPNPSESDQYAIKIGVEYNYSNRGEWHYDTTSGKYLRWIEEKDDDNHFSMIPLVDRLTNIQLSFSNVIIIYAKYIEYAPTLHDIFIWNNTEGQRAVLYRDGIMIECKWKTIDHNLPVYLYNEYSLPVALKPGNTWVIIAGLHSELTQVQPGQWEMVFSLP